MPESTAQFTAPEVVPQTAPACEFCGVEIVLDPNLRECCHKQAAVHHTLQLDSARNASRHIIVLHKQVHALTERVAALEALVDQLTQPQVVEVHSDDTVTMRRRVKG